MKGLRPRRPSPALVISLIALLVAMGGTGYAAFKLPKNSVGGKQLKKNAVTGAKVKDQSLTGADINLGELGKVPSATAADSANHAAVADSANAIAAPEATHLVGAPGEPAFQSGSSNLTPPPLGYKFQPVGFYKDREGIVHLQGVAVVGTGGPPAGVIFTLPPGYRPASGTVAPFNVLCGKEGGTCTRDSGTNEEQYSVLLVAGSNTHSLSTTLDGDVVGRAGTIMSLEGVTFRAES